MWPFPTSCRSSSVPAPVPVRATALGETVHELAELAADLNQQGDRRGLFFVLYAPTVARIQAEIEKGTFSDPEVVKRVAAHLADRAIGSLTQSNPDPRSAKAWDTVNALAAEPSIPDQTVLGAALNAHLTVDLPDAPRLAGAHRGFSSDLQALGRALVKETLRMQHAPSGPEAHTVELFEQVPLVAALERLVGHPFLRRIGYAVMLAEALEQAQWTFASVDRFVDDEYSRRDRLMGVPSVNPPSPPSSPGTISNVIQMQGAQARDSNERHP